jgi:lysophospholipase L1-like esterase
VGQRKTAGLAGIAATVAVAIGCCLALPGCSAGSVPPAASGGGTAQNAPDPAPWTGTRDGVTRTLASRDTFAACERQLENEPRTVPTIAIVGASFTAGVGPDNPSLSWAADLARQLHWDAVIYGVAGAGYTHPGEHRLGPVARLLAAEGLPALAPALVIVQAGHDDAGIAASIERRQVRRTLAMIHAQAPHARIALITVFTGPRPPVPAAMSQLDSEIVGAAKAADPKVIIMDPLTGHWKFARAHSGLHPSKAGDAWIARKVAAILRAHGVDPSKPAATAPLVCIRAVGLSATASA